MIRHGIFRLEDVLSCVEPITAIESYTREYNSIMVDMRSQRYHVFADNSICVSCGLKGTHFALERHNNSPKHKWHFNLYATNARGEEVLMTKDHILPKSKGGTNTLNNYQTMCMLCNNRKADNYVGGRLGCGMSPAIQHIKDFKKALIDLCYEYNAGISAEDYNDLIVDLLDKDVIEKIIDARIGGNFENRVYRRKHND